MRPEERAGTFSVGYFQNLAFSGCFPRIKMFTQNLTIGSETKTIYERIVQLTEILLLPKDNNRRARSTSMFLQSRAEEREASSVKFV